MLKKLFRLKSNSIQAKISQTTIKNDQLNEDKGIQKGIFVAPLEGILLPLQDVQNEVPVTIPIIFTNLEGGRFVSVMVGESVHLGQQDIFEIKPSIFGLLELVRNTR